VCVSWVGLRKLFFFSFSVNNLFFKKNQDKYKTRRRRRIRKTIQRGGDSSCVTWRWKNNKKKASIINRGGKGEEEKKTWLTHLSEYMLAGCWPSSWGNASSPPFSFSSRSETVTARRARSGVRFLLFLVQKKLLVYSQATISTLIGLHFFSKGLIRDYTRTWWRVSYLTSINIIMRERQRPWVDRVQVSSFHTLVTKLGCM